MKLDTLRKTKLNTEILSLHSNNKEYRKYKRMLIDEELLYECIVTNKWTSLHTSKILSSLGVKCDPSYIISRCKEYDSIPVLTSADSAHRSMERRIQTNLEIYGAANPLSKGTVAYNKRNDTVKQKYGTSNVFGCDEVKEKIKRTNLEKYGTEHPAHGARPYISGPHRIVSDYLNDIGIKHENEKRNIFQKFNEELGRVYSPIVDIYIDEKRVIEVYGDYYHCNPAHFKENDILSNHYFMKNRLVKDLWNHDECRIRHIESFGCDVLIIWETDVNNDNFRRMIHDWLSNSKSAKN